MELDQVHHVLRVIHYIAPCLLFAYFSMTVLMSFCIISPKKTEARARPRKKILWSMGLVAATYFGQAAVTSVQIFTGMRESASRDSNIYALSSFLMWVILLIVCVSSESPKWWPFYSSWLYSLTIEITLLSLSLGYVRPSKTLGRVQIGLQILRIVLLVLLLILVFTPGSIQRWRQKGDEEAAPLLGHPQEVSEDTPISKAIPNYGSTELGNDADNTSTTEENLDAEAKELQEEQAKMKRVHDRMEKAGSWVAYAREFLIFIPYIWPSAPQRLQLNMIGIGFCVLCRRVLKVLVPRQLGIVVDGLGHKTGAAPFFELGLYVVLLWANSSAGVSGLKNWLFLPVELSAKQAIDTSSYNHIMGLSCEFHDSKRSGELQTAIQQGHSVIDLLELILFDFLPILADLLLACAYLYYLFDTYMFLIVAATMIIYVWISTYFISRQASLRRESVRHQREASQVLYDTMGGWKTVSYFNRLQYAKEQYSSAASRLSISRLRYWLMGYFSYSFQGLVLDVGLFGACFYAVYQVVYGNQSVGSFVTLLTYWAGLVGPLAYLTNAHREIIGYLVDAEQLLELFQTKPTVNNGENVLHLKEGRVTFDNVDFGYDGKKQIITDLSFEASPGQTIALVGETGGGKSTILKLIFRFYDVKGGAILIDGQDVRSLTLESLRECIGVVPQDPTLFNETIMSNVRYAKLDATDEEVESACQAAAVHEKIMTFTEKYMSKVGERGVKLSGGELQRIAIARAILKDPKIILLDEATSSVDSETESKIQEALTRLSKGRTTFVVAHRLSTIIDADLILVIKDGRILEQGRPADLLKSKGKYYNLWCKQMGITTKAAIAENETTPSEEDQQDNPAQQMIPSHISERGRRLERDDENKDGLEHSRPGLSKSSSKSKSIIDSYTKKSFRPDAPEFVPQASSGTASSSEMASNSHEPVLHDDNHGFTKSTAIQNGKRPLRNKSKPKKDFQHDLNNHIDGSGKVGRIQDTSKEPHHVQSTNETVVEPKPKRSRVDRRRQSRSQPANQSLFESQGDGASNLDPILTGLGERQPVPSSSRRSSAPSHPPAGPSKLQRSAKWPRRHVRHDHGRIKTQDKVKNPESASKGPSEGSTDSSQLTNPTASSPSLASGINPTQGLPEMPSESNFHFAPGS